ncbi:MULTISPECIES: hypothetical protein [unclassified Moorena]|uniref:hypothetical protein n=1 Tax=unclassified Moorena TaxID=2683338 RepID=UPI0002D7B8EC|nr:MULTISPECIES: hypothetical protein [unclassified Moorena]NES40010.1 hypothetical protein [Moorena sp. SIO2C4]
MKILFFEFHDITSVVGWNKIYRKHSAISGQWSAVSAQQSADITEIKPMLTYLIQKLKGKHSGVSLQPLAES